MKTKSKIIKAILFTVLLAGAGCVSGQRILTGKALPATIAEAVSVVSVEPPGADQIGIVSANAAGKSQYASELAVNELKRQAARIGANRILIVSAAVATSPSAGGIGYVSPTGLLFQPNLGGSHATVIQARAFYVKE